MQRATGGGEVAARAADQIGRSLHAGLHERTQGEDRVIRLRPGEAGQRSNAEEYIAMNPAALQVFCNATAKAQKMMHTDDSVFTQVAERYFPKFAPW